MSYTRFDDHHDRGAISEFRLRLSNAVRAVTGRPFEIFQDIDGIGLGEKWSGKLDQILDQARFFIPILTPSYFSSAACRDELEKFLRAEAERGRSDLVLPIYYIECDVLEDPDLRRADPLAIAIHERQRQDWRDLRFEPFTSPRVRRTLESLAREIVQACRREEPLMQNQRSDKPQSTVPRLAAQFETSPVFGDDFWTGSILRDIDAPWCPELVVAPRGEFVMGSPSDEEGRYHHEGPQHEVRIDYDLAVGRYPITFREYDRFVEAAHWPIPPDQHWGRGQRPVINVTWQDAQAYVAWLGREAGQRYRLLSEAEWEYVCRAGTATRYWWGDEIAPENANHDALIGGTTEAGSYPPNPWGLYDTHGNVWEWVENCWGDSYLGAPNDGSVRIEGRGRLRVLRGGAWDAHPSFLRSASRSKSPVGHRDSSCGFRVARTIR